MGGNRIAEQVRRALILAAKIAPVAVMIDAAGCAGEARSSCEYLFAPHCDERGAISPTRGRQRLLGCQSTGGTPILGSGGRNGLRCKQ
jgi:hypothetical protein